MLPACVGLVPFGVVCGVGAAAAGADWLAALGMALFIFSGAAQILAVQLYAANAPIAIIVLTCFVLGLRFLMYSAAMAPYMRAAAGELAAGARVPAYRPGVRRGDPQVRRIGGRPRRGLHFLGSGIAVWANWVATNMMGYFAGASIPPSWSLDFAVPLCFIALVAPLFRSVPSVVAAVRGRRGPRAGRAADAPQPDRRRPDRHRRWHARRPRGGAMEGALKLWVVIVAVGALNYLSRLSFIAFFASREMPPLLARALRFVPAAMLTALVLPMVLAPSWAGTIAGVNPRIPAAIVAAVVAFYTRSTLKTLATGMGALWLLEAAIR
ncbi:MAG: AzlC family ABC transporter permease [Betaproteobacteria bacterium]|nr:AzlC family ABC transporter permease [Betaproteobacteria bacterium]